MSGLALGDVTAHYGRAVALDGVDLEVRPGEIVAVLGVNGAGKSTLAGVAAGLHPIQAGQVRLAGTDMLQDPARARRHLGFAGQDVGLYPTETLRDNLRLFGTLAGLRGRSLASRVDDVAAAIGLAGALDRRADRCSAGERRRAHVAAALLHQPAVVVLDEPAAHLDPAGRRDVHALAEAAAQRGAAVCWCTNDPDEAGLVAHRVAILDRGRLLLEGRPMDLAQRLAPPTVEILFDGPAPRLADAAGLQGAGPLLRLVVSDVRTALPEALTAIAHHTDRVRSLRILEPNLATAFSTVTRAQSDGQADPALATRVVS